jgi:hypothetical protein
MNKSKNNIKKISQFLKMKAELDALKEDMRLNSLWMEIKEKSRKGLLPEIDLPEVHNANKRSNNGK